uniref:Uncharacterized protein n=1 Tax=Glossina morsitans morsitans TaxID=37546 RepID=A0A1B0GAZ1_GLOMM
MLSEEHQESGKDLKKEQNVNMDIEHIDDMQDEVFEINDWDDCSEQDLEGVIEQHEGELILSKGYKREVVRDNTSFSITVNETNKYEEIIRRQK